MGPLLPVGPFEAIFKRAEQRVIVQPMAVFSGELFEAGAIGSIAMVAEMSEGCRQQRQLESAQLRSGDGSPVADLRARPAEFGLRDSGESIDRDVERIDRKDAERAVW